MGKKSKRNRNKVGLAPPPTPRVPEVRKADDSDFSARSMAFENERTMRFFAEQIASVGFHFEDGRPFTMRVYDTMAPQMRKKFLALFFQQEWDMKSNEEKMNEVSKMPPECHVCNRQSNSMQPDGTVGYTRLICMECAMQKMLFGM